jgi:hypothetical protein
MNGETQEWWGIVCEQAAKEQAKAEPPEYATEALTFIGTRNEVDGAENCHNPE